MYVSSKLLAGLAAGAGLVLALGAAPPAEGQLTSCDIQLAGYVPVFTAKTVTAREARCRQPREECEKTFGKACVELYLGEGQRVVVAGDPDGTRRWGVDDALRINGHTLTAISRAYNPTIGSDLPESAWVRCQDLQGYLDGSGTLSIEQLDVGGWYASTDVYLVIAGEDKLPCE